MNFNFWQWLGAALLLLGLTLYIIRHTGGVTPPIIESTQPAR